MSEFQPRDKNIKKGTLWNALDEFGFFCLKKNKSLPSKKTSLNVKSVWQTQFKIVDRAKTA